MDFKTGKIVLKAMKRLNEKEGKNFVIVTQNAVIGKIANQVVHLHDGQVEHIKVVKNLAS